MNTPEYAAVNLEMYKGNNLLVNSLLSLENNLTPLKQQASLNC